MTKVTIRTKFSGSGDPKQWIQEKVDKIEAGNQEILADALQEGEGIMKHNIESRGTSLSGKRGRIETGKMLDAVNSVVRERSNTKFLGAFGWVDKQEDYFVYQENGFHHVGSGRMIEGMYALQDAADEIWVNIREDIERNIRGA